MKRIHVVAAILRDAAGRVLLAQRGAGKHLEGLWEFPGGKVEADESPVAALRRELHEEIGVELDRVEPLIAVPWRYPEKHVDLDVYDAREWRGEPHGREGQAIAWCEPDAMHAYAMPEADRPVVTALRLPRVMLVTPPVVGDPPAYLARIESALAGDARFVQVRVRADDASRAAIVPRVVALAQARGAIVVVNGNAAEDRYGAGLHLRAAAAAALEARPVPRANWFGVSAHDEAELAHALVLDADYVVIGPVRATTSHPGADGIGWTRFAALAARSPVPCYAIGGLAPDDLALARTFGAFGVAGIRAFGAPDAASRAEKR